MAYNIYHRNDVTYIRATAILNSVEIFVRSKSKQEKEISLINKLNVLLVLLSTVFKSCAEVKTSGVSSDGHYLVHVFDRCKDSHRLYCHQMASNTPQEFITLNSGAENNFALIYHERLQDRFSCSGPARTELYAEQGTTNFTKVRFDIATMKIISDDFTFAQTSEGKDIAYGTAGDCYSMNTGKCRKGEFKIHLNGTGFRVRDDVTWTLQGFPNGMQMQDYQKLYGGVVVSAKCGGWCGRCKPTRGDILVESMCTNPAGALHVCMCEIIYCQK